MKEDKNPIQVAGRLFGTLEFLAEHGASGLMDISEHLELNKSTAHRVVSSLQYMGYVRQIPENGKYELTFRIVDLSSKVINHMDIIGAVRPYLRSLMEQTQETVHFVKREGAEIVYIDKVEAYQNSVRMVSQVGSRIPFYRSAVGKAMAANMPDEVVRDLWNDCEIVQTTPYTITDYGRFAAVLEEVRRNGYALDNEENETGVRCIGTSLGIASDSGLKPGTEYAISISVPVSRMDDERIRELAQAIIKTREAIEGAL